MTAKEQLAELASELYLAGVDLHAAGVTLIQRSARLEQASRICNEEQAKTFLAAYLAEEAEHDEGVSSPGGEA